MQNQGASGDSSKEDDVDGRNFTAEGMDSHTSSGYFPHPKEGIGLKCKRLVDLARLSYLQEHGFDARLVYFVGKTTSLENVLLIATPTA